jgi:hypothetical protein
MPYLWDGHRTDSAISPLHKESTTQPNLRAMQILPGRSNIENIVPYLGVDVGAAIALAKRTEIWAGRLLAVSVDHS